MFEQAPEWISRSPLIRKVVVKTWRAFLRVQRSTLAQAVLVARRQDGCVLAVAISSGELRLPYVELHGWAPVGTQVQAWADGMLRHPAKLKLAAIEGTPGREGVTFLYSAELEDWSGKIGDTWLEAKLASFALQVDDRRRLLKVRLYPPTSGSL
jgi:hypothetical protein